MVSPQSIEAKLESPKWVALLVLDPIKIIVIAVIILNTHQKFLFEMSQRVESGLDDSQRQWMFVVLVKLHTAVSKVDQHHLILSIHDVSNPIMMDITQLQ